jgi:acetyl esterase/lipase
MAIAASERVTIEEGVVFGTGGGRNLKCDVFTPPGRPRNAPAVLLLHGGGWRQGDRSQLRGYGILLGRKGYVCVCSEYRLMQESIWPAQIHDVKAALRWMRANAGELGLDPEKIAVEGNSAGAHLSLMAAGTANLPEFEGEGGNPGVGTGVAASIAIYAPALLQPNELVDALLGPRATEADYQRASPVHYARRDFPPTLLIHGTADTTVPVKSSHIMHEALEQAGATVEIHTYAGQPHAFDAQPPFGRQVAEVMALFLSRYLGGGGCRVGASPSGSPDATSSPLKVRGYATGGGKRAAPL